MYTVDGVVTVGGVCQLVLGSSIARTFLLLQNTGIGPLLFEFGSARATATVVAGVVTAVTVTNSGQGFSRAPSIEFQGGGGKDGPLANSAYVGLGQSLAASPHNFAVAHCVMSGAAPNMSVASIIIDNGGANYLAAPYVHIHDSRLDPNGVATASSTIGILLGASTPPLIWNGTACMTDAISVWGGTTGQPFVCRWMD